MRGCGGDMFPGQEINYFRVEDSEVKVQNNIRKDQV